MSYSRNSKEATVTGVRHEKNWKDRKGPAKQVFIFDYGMDKESLKFLE